MKKNRSASFVSGFSLVEVTVAIGIFAFVVVGVLGLLPVGMRMRAESAAETRGILIAEELFAAVRSAESLTNVIVRDGPALEQRNNQPVNIRNGETVVVGYPSGSTVPFFLWGGQRSAGSPESAWAQGTMPPGALANGIDTLARLSATRLPGDSLYRVDVEVRAPASVPLANTRSTRFSTLIRAR